MNASTAVGARGACARPSWTAGYSTRRGGLPHSGVVALRGAVAAWLPAPPMLEPQCLGTDNRTALAQGRSQHGWFAVNLRVQQRYKPIPGGPGWDKSTPATWPATTSTLVSGERDAVLVDALITISEAERLTAWVKGTGKQLHAIFVTHGHAGHFSGAGLVLDAFPGAELISCDQRKAVPSCSARLAQPTGRWPRSFTCRTCGLSAAVTSRTTTSTCGSGDPRRTQGRPGLRRWTRSR